MKLALQVVLIVTLVLTVSSQTCSKFVGKNITAANVQSPSYVASSEACCATCQSIAGCAAAVYESNLCTLKVAAGPMTDASFGEVLVVGTIAPPSPVPPTPAPTLPHQTIVEVINCVPGASCTVGDAACTTTLHVEGQCYGKGNGMTYHCYPGFVQKMKYSGPRCTGSATDAGTLTWHSCDDEGTSIRCFNATAPPPGKSLVHKTSCLVSSCSDCSSTSAITGQCRQGSW